MAEFSGDRVDGVPIRLPILLRERDELNDRDVLGEGATREGREEIVGLRLGVGVTDEGFGVLVDGWPIRLPILLRERDELNDRDVLGEEVVGVRLGAGAAREGVVALVDVLLLERLGVNDRLRDVIRLLDVLGLDVLGETVRRELGTVLRLTWVLDRDGLLMRGLACRLGVAGRREIELRLLRVGMDRCGVGREIDRELDRLVAERMVCRLLVWLLLLLLELLLRELRRDDCASATRASNSTAITATATPAVLPLDICFFARNIIRLLSPAACFSGDPGLPFPHHRRHPTCHVRSSDL